jgi:hypothetical protein
MRSTKKEREIIEWGCGQNLKYLDVAKRNTLSLQHELVHGALTKLGFEGVLDFTTCVPAAKFEENATEIVNVCEKVVNTLLEEPLRKTRTKSAKLKAKQSLSTCLQRMFSVRIICAGRVMSQNDRQTLYKLEIDKKILGFSELSDYYSRQWIDEVLSNTEKNRREYEERLETERKQNKRRLENNQREQQAKYNASERKWIEKKKQACANGCVCNQEQCKWH